MVEVAVLAWSILCWGIVAESASILGVFHTHGRSHFAVGEALLKGLAARGHQVTMLSAYPQSQPCANYTDVHIHGVEYIYKKNRHTLKKGEMESYVTHAVKIYSICSQEAEYMLQHQSYKNLLKSDQRFDMVILDNCANYFHLGIAHHYGAASVILSTMGLNQASARYSGNPFPPSYVPLVILPYSDDMHFFQRLRNAWSVFFCSLIENFLFLPRYQSLLHTYFPDAPPLDILMKNVSLVFANSHILVETARPVMPIVKLVGGMHVREPQKLPLNIQQFLDGAQEGAILLSLGSNIRMSELPPEKLDVLVKVLSQCSQRILWKWENRTEHQQNIIFHHWLPQNDILAHPNVKLLISHGGLNSLIEAMYRGVPVLGIPFFGDQHNNIATAVKMGHALHINLQDLTVDSLSHALHQIINNPKYTLEAKRRSHMVSSEPMKPLESAIYWVEYILQYNGGRNLRAKGNDLSIWTYLLIDVIVFSLGIFIFGGWLCWCALRKIFGFRNLIKMKTN